VSFGENGPSPKQRLDPLNRSLGAPGTRGRASWNRLWAPWGLVGGAGLGLELPNRPILTTRKSRPVHAPHTMWGCQGPMLGVYWPWVCVAGSLRTVRERGKRWRHDICKFCCFFSEFLPARTSHRRSAGPRGLRLVAAVETHHGTGLGPFNPLVPCITVARTCDTGQRFASPLHQAE
jgi:hypothetical protein